MKNFNESNLTNEIQQEVENALKDYFEILLEWINTEIQDEGEI